MQRQLICTLPPTCNPPTNRPCQLNSAADLERHYATYHAHVCEERGCGAVFPEARLLELHQTECHDPIAALRKEKGEKIFACHLASCPRLFSTPKTRRLHLIQAHGFPKEYFFAVTNKGVGGLLKKWGEGASLVRGKWSPREPKQDGAMDEDQSDKEEHDHADERGRLQAAPPTTTSSKPPGFRLGDGPLIEEDSDADDAPTRAAGAPAPEIDSLAKAVDALALVPPHVRFGRGAKAGGFAHAPRSHGQHHPRHAHARTTGGEGMDVDQAHQHGRGAGHGRKVSQGTQGEASTDDRDDEATAVEDSPPVNTRRPPMPPRGIGRGLGRGGMYGRGRIHVGSQGYGRKY